MNATYKIQCAKKKEQPRVSEADHSSRQRQVVVISIRYHSTDEPPKKERNMTNEGIDGTERFSSPDKGRGLRALRHFAVGELVFACPAYSYVLTVNERGAYCEQCFTR